MNSDTPSVDTKKHVLVVGAGLAGLSAAVALADGGVEVTVLEARERVGGRVWSPALDNGEVVELGAEWVMPDDQELFDMAERFGVPLVEAGIDYLRREGLGERGATVAQQEAYLEAASKVRSTMTDAEVAAATLGSFLDRVPGTDAQRQTVRMRLQGTSAWDIEHVALRVIDGEGAFSAGGGVRRYSRVRGGNQRLAEAMAAWLPDVRLGKVVDAITYDDHGVMADIGAEERIRADAAVIAVPAPITAKLRFEPALPKGLAAALRELPMGVASKFAVATKGRPTHRALQSTELPLWCWAANGKDGVDGGEPRKVIASFAGSSLAQEGLETNVGRVGPWLDRLRAMNPDLSLVGEPFMYAWADDPFTAGCYSAWDNRSWDRADLFARPTGRVAFAGEHTAGRAHHGTMNGALVSGLRAARQTAEVLARR
jgi:monoamine oxidase